jgi:mannose-6-phosphate isomerase-like protein (cupin superfamily)
MTQMRTLCAATLFAAVSPVLLAQTADERIDLYFGDWRASTPRITHGVLEERDIFTRGDPLNPKSKGAVLRFINSYSYATLRSHSSTTATKLSDQQEIIYIASGHGTATAGNDSVDLHKGVAILIPPQLEYTVKNDAPEALTMYLVNEPTQPGFRPNTKILAKDENLLPIVTSSDHWDRIVKAIFSSNDGLSTLQQFSTVTLDTLTITQPELVRHGDREEVWTELDGTSIAFLGSRLRRQSPGVAFLSPPDHKTPLSSLNYSEQDQVKLLYFVRTISTATGGN